MAKQLQTRIPGVGFIFKSKYTYKGELKQSPFWSIRLAGGASHSTGIADQAGAYAELLRYASQLTTIVRGTIGELLDVSYKSAVRDAKNRTLRDKKGKIEILKKQFGQIKISEFNPEVVEQWLDRRHLMPKPGTDPGKKALLTNASKNRYVSEFKRAFKIATQQRPPLAGFIPHFKSWEEDNVREGILSARDYERLRDAFMVDHARLWFVLAYHFGMRVGELLLLTWPQVDLEAGLIRLKKKQTKGKKDRVVPLFGETRHYLAEAYRQKDPNCDRVIQYEGAPLLCIRRAWATACKIANLPGLLQHDMRRTALTNLVTVYKLTIPEAMSISGHTTIETFIRYLISTDEVATGLGEKLNQVQYERPVREKRSNFVSN